MAEQENNVPVIKWPQWSNGKTVSCNAMSLKLFAFIITYSTEQSPSWEANQ